MSELSKATKVIKGEREKFTEYLSTITEESLHRLKNELERGIIHGKPLTCDILSTIFTKPYDMDMLREMFVMVEDEVQARSFYALQVIEKYLKEARPIIEKGIQNKELLFSERIMLHTYLELACKYTNELNIKVVFKDSDDSIDESALEIGKEYLKKDDVLEKIQSDFGVVYDMYIDKRENRMTEKGIVEVCYDEIAQDIRLLPAVSDVYIEKDKILYTIAEKFDFLNHRYDRDAYKAVVEKCHENILSRINGLYVTKK